MPNRQSQFVHGQNIENFMRQLKTETDPRKRKVLLELLEAEKAGFLESSDVDDPSDNPPKH